MPRGIKFKTAINKVMGKFLTDNGFEFEMALDGVYYYKRESKGSRQRMTLDIKWAPEFMVQEYLKYRNISPDRNWDAYQHELEISLRSIYLDGTYVVGNLRRIIDYLENPQFRKRPLSDEQSKDHAKVCRNNFLINYFFITQEELEQKLEVVIQGMEKYGLPFLEGDNLWMKRGRIRSVNDRQPGTNQSGKTE